MRHNGINVEYEVKVIGGGEETPRVIVCASRAEAIATAIEEREKAIARRNRECETEIDEMFAKWANRPVRITASKRVVRLNARPRRPVLELLSERTYIDYKL